MADVVTIELDHTRLTIFKGVACEDFERSNAFNDLLR